MSLLSLQLLLFLRLTFPANELDIIRGVLNIIRENGIKSLPWSNLDVLEKNVYSQRFILLAF